MPIACRGPLREGSEATPRLWRAGGMPEPRRVGGTLKQAPSGRGLRRSRWGSLRAETERSCIHQRLDVPVRNREVMQPPETCCSLSGGISPSVAFGDSSLGEGACPRGGDGSALRAPLKKAPSPEPSLGGAKRRGNRYSRPASVPPAGEAAPLPCPAPYPVSFGL